MLQRQVYRVNKKGSLKNLKLQTETLHQPAAGEVCVKVEAIGLNFADIFAIQGLYRATPEGSFIPGLEFCGVIMAIGDEVAGWNVGDKVMGATKFGGYVSHINIGSQYIVALPGQWTFNEGAGFLVQGLTAYYALTVLGNLQKGMCVLIQSAAGGVGLLANRICKKFDAFTIGAVGNSAKAAFLRNEEAYDEVIVRDGNFRRNLVQAGGNRPLELVMECIGGKILKQSWEVMAPRGRMIVYGSASFATHGSKPNYPAMLWRYINRPKIDPLTLPELNKSLMGFNLIYLYEQTNLLHQMLAELNALQIKPQHIGHVFEFGDMYEALRLYQKGGTMGKVVVRTA